MADTPDTPGPPDTPDHPESPNAPAPDKARKDFTPVNELEQALLDAPSDLEARKRFYQLLAEAPLFVVTPDRDKLQARQQGAADEQTSLSLAHVDINKKPHIALFTAPQRAQVLITEDMTAVGMPGRRVLEATLGQAIALNPGSPVGKLLTADEVRTVLEGHEHEVGMVHLEPGTEVVVGQPREKPAQLIQALRSLFAEAGTVSKASLAMMAIPSKGVQPRVIVGVESEADPTPLFEEANRRCEGLPGTERGVDFYHVKNNQPNYFQQADVFYRRG